MPRFITWFSLKKAEVGKWEIISEVNLTLFETYTCRRKLTYLFGNRVLTYRTVIRFWNVSMIRVTISSEYISCSHTSIACQVDNPLSILSICLRLNHQQTGLFEFLRMHTTKCYSHILLQKMTITKNKISSL